MNDMRNIFKESAALFEFNDNNNLIFNGNKKDLSKSQRKVFKGLSK